MKSPLLLIALILGGCSLFQKNNKEAKELLSNINPQWFNTNSSHAIWNRDGKAQPHSFFDVNAELSTNAVNVVIVTPQNSSYGYDLDLASGKRFYSHSYCPQNDVWNKFSGSIWKPNFSIAVIPGHMDQTGEPQRVLIFGGDKKFSRLAEDHYHRVKLVGAVLHQSCPTGNCLGKNNWLSRLVFLAVDPDDEKFEGINSIEELQKTLDWAQTQAVIENIEGRNGTATSNYPAVRVGNIIGLQAALDHYNKYSIKMTRKEAAKIQKNCFTLYDKLWKDVGIERPEDKIANSSEELKEKIRLRDQLKKQQMPVGFAARLRKFTKAYWPEITTCSRYVYAGNINKDPESFWFLAQMSMYYRLHKEGYFFDCNVKSWQTNFTKADGDIHHNLKRDIDFCSDKDIDTAMNFLPNFLAGIKGRNESYYRYVEYDTHGFGTHGKLYSWVKMKGRTFSCAYDPNEEVKREVKLYPDDVVWRPRNTVDVNDREKVIY